ncbi:MAG: U32 family peptidase [Candidatus Pacebacteria bacterium]|nr:U32 family peptidase [Candidatus Paceibacterota bacterium]
MLKYLNDTELLAPAGSFEKLKYGLEFGADAVYAGLPDFSLRARINKFDEKNIIEAINYTHSKNKKIYITINIFAHNHHLNNLKKHLRTLRKNPPDALIVSDVGVVEIAKKILPNVDIHLSTQANTTNFEAAKFWFKQGIKRIVLAREVTLEEIKEIHQKVPKLELEYFVHGAMCMAYSGRCFLSVWQTGRSSNLGDCAQNCRWQYSLVEEKRPNEYMPIEQDDQGTYFLNSKDLCLIEYLEELKKAGITSFKIEGRAKSVYYLAQVVKAYKLALEIKSNDKNKKTKIKKLKNDLNKLVNRTWTTGFLFGECKFKGQETRFSHTEEKYEFVGEVRNQVLGTQNLVPTVPTILIKVHNAIFTGDGVEFIQPNNKNIFCKIKNIYDDKSFDKLKSAHGGQERMVYVEVSKTPEIFSVMRKRIKY